MLYNIILVLFVLVSISLIGLILIQHGKGADAGAAFGSGASGTVFGSRGAASFLTRTTAILATLFFVLSLTLAYLLNVQSKTANDKTQIEEQVQQTQQIESDVPVTESKPEGAANGSSPASDVPTSE